MWWAHCNKQVQFGLDFLSLQLFWSRNSRKEAHAESRVGVFCPPQRLLRAGFRERGNVTPQRLPSRQEAVRGRPLEEDQSGSFCVISVTGNKGK